MSDVKKFIKEKENTEGRIKISEEAVEVIADKAIRDIDGVAGLTAGIIGNVKDVFGKKTGAKGVDVEITEDKEAVITMHVVIKYGCRIPEIAWRIQGSVKNAVESMTNLEVKKVNVYVDGVKFPEELQKSKKAK